jgi:hypothetical protein
MEMEAAALVYVIFVICGRKKQVARGVDEEISEIIFELRMRRTEYAAMTR